MTAPWRCPELIPTELWTLLFSFQGSGIELLKCVCAWAVTADPMAKDQTLLRSFVHVPNVSNVMQSPRDEVSRRSLTLSYSLFISWFYYSSYPIKTYFLWFQLCSFYYPCQDQSYGGMGIACRALEIGWCCLIPRPLFSRIYRDFRNQILAWMPWSAWWTIPCTDCHGPCRSISGCGADSSVLNKQICKASSWQSTSSDLKHDTAWDICFKGITAPSLFELNTRLCLYFFD